MRQKQDEIVDVHFNVYAPGAGAVMIGFATKEEADSIDSPEIIARVTRKMVYRPSEGMLAARSRKGEAE